MKRAPLRAFEHPLQARFFSGTRSWPRSRPQPTPGSGRSPWESSRDLCVDLWCRPRAALHCFAAITSHSQRWQKRVDDALFSTQNGGEKTVRGGSSNDSRTPTAGPKRLRISEGRPAGTDGLGAHGDRALSVDDGQVLCFHASSVVDSGDCRPPPHPLPGVSLPAVSAPGLRRLAIVFISRTPENPGKWFCHFPRACVVVRGR